MSVDALAGNDGYISVVGQQRQSRVDVLRGESVAELIDGTQNVSNRCPLVHGMDNT